MKKFILIIGILLPLTIYAQDKIYKPDGSQIEVKVLEITPTEIKYKKFSNLDGPVYTIYKSEVLLIVYENGESEVINIKSSDIGKSKDKKDEYGRSILSFNPLHLAFGNVTMSYEAINKSEKLGFKIPIYIGYSGDYLASGLDLKIYPTGQGKVKYFFGPSTQLGISYGKTIIFTHTAYGRQHEHELIGDFPFTSLQLNNGVSFNPNYSFNIALEGSLGIIIMKTKHRPALAIIFPYWLIGLNFGWRF